MDHISNRNLGPTLLGGSYDLVTTCSWAYSPTGLTYLRQITETASGDKPS